MPTYPRCGAGRTEPRARSLCRSTRRQAASPAKLTLPFRPHFFFCFSFRPLLCPLSPPSPSPLFVIVISPCEDSGKKTRDGGEKIESPQRAPGLLPATRPARVPRLANHTPAQGPPGLPSALAVASRSFGSVRLPPPAAGPPRICWVGTYAARFPTTDADGR